MNTIRRTGANEKKQFSLLLSPFSLLLLFAFIFSGCEKDDIGNPKADSFNGKITAKVEIGASYNSQISKVWALFDAEIYNGNLTGRMVAEGVYADGGFTIDLPEIPASFLMNIQTFFKTVLNVSGELEYSDPDTRLLDVDFFGMENSNSYVDYFLYTNTGSKRTTCLHVFVDSEVTVKGGTNVGVAFKPGWNRIYVSPGENKISSKAPSGMKWYLKQDVK
jgi:hypothetical protein